MLVAAAPTRAFGITEDLLSLSELVKQLKPAVVNISTTSVLTGGSSPFGWREGDPFDDFFKRFFGNMPERQFRQRGLGSGFIISEDGYIVTNNHVVGKASDIEVILEDGEKYKAEVVGTDPKTDVALLKIKPRSTLPTVRFGDSSNLEIGDWVIAIGNPFGLGHTVTTGIISAKGRSLGMGAYDDFLQTDAAINPGNSGGPLFNLKGEVVGVNTAIIAGGQGIGFAIPGDMVRYLVDQLKSKGRVVRGWLGVLVQQVTPEIAESMNLKNAEGALVADVTSGGPAEKAGIKRGDVIVAFNGKKIKVMPDLPKLVALAPPERESKVNLYRNGMLKTIKIRIEEMPDDLGRAKRKETEKEKHLGVVVQEVTPGIQRRFNLESSTGVVITRVERGSLASNAGLRTGDLVVEINKRSIKDLSDYRSAVDSLKPGKTALILVRRGSNTIYVALKVDDEDKG